MPKEMRGGKGKMYRVKSTSREGPELPSGPLRACGRSRLPAILLRDEGEVAIRTGVASRTQFHAGYASASREFS